MNTPHLTLSQLNAQIREAISRSFPQTYWIVAETIDVRLNKNGHCYLELIEKHPNTSAIQARNRAYIWNTTFRMLSTYFQQQTGQTFTSGIKVLVHVSVDYHPLYGLGLNILDIDPTYTLGDIQRRRQETLDRLTQDGIIDLNKQLPFPALPRRIAIITSPTAAGYEDFLQHLTHNTHGFTFQPTLFPAVMQGQQTEASIVKALEHIFIQQSQFDLVAIIRGGGATADLAAFDSYLLASHCAQFPLPIITGIGHERDTTVLDHVAHLRAKTPTAVADLIINHMATTYQTFQQTCHKLKTNIQTTIQSRLDTLNRINYRLPLITNTYFTHKHHQLDTTYQKIQSSTRRYLDTRMRNLDKTETFLRLSDPIHLLKQGYSITYKNGKAVQSTTQLQEGDQLQTRFADGVAQSIVTKK